MKHSKKIIMLAGITTVASVFNSAPAQVMTRPGSQARLVSSSNREVLDVAPRFADWSVC